jgi:hypothetical protein
MTTFFYDMARLVAGSYDLVGVPFNPAYVWIINQMKWQKTKDSLTLTLAIFLS